MVALQATRLIQLGNECIYSPEDRGRTCMLHANTAPEPKSGMSTNSITTGNSLANQESNPDQVAQNHTCYRYTTGQKDDGPARTGNREIRNLLL